MGRNIVSKINRINLFVSQQTILDFSQFITMHDNTANNFFGNLFWTYHSIWKISAELALSAKHFKLLIRIWSLECFIQEYNVPICAFNLYYITKWRLIEIYIPHYEWTFRLCKTIFSCTSGYYVLNSNFLSMIL